METRANYILIGLFTILGGLGILAMFLIFASVDLDEELAYYDVRFESVSGLSEAADVRFAGFPVGQVVDIRLAPERDGTVLVRLEVDAATPVRADSVATIESLGVTGVSFVAIGAGTPEAALLDGRTEPVPEIEAGRSVIQTLSQDAPALVTEALELVEAVSDLFTDENAQRIDNIIQNAETASEAFASTLEGFATVTESVNAFVEQIDRFNATLQVLSADLGTALVSADETITAYGDLAGEAGAFVTEGRETLAALRATLARADGYIDEDLSAATAEAEAALAELRTEVAALSELAAGAVSSIEGTSALAAARLEELEGTLDGIDTLVAELGTAFDAVYAAAVNFDTLVVDQGGPFLTEARAVLAEASETITSVGATIEEEFPLLVEDVRTAARTANETVAAVGEDLTAASGRIEGLSASAEATLAQVTATFANANTTLEAINEAMIAGQSALAAAEGSFAEAETLIAEDIAGLMTRIEETLGGLDGAIEQVSADLPAISEDLASAAAAAEEAFTTLSAAVETAGPAVAEFTDGGLGQFTRLAREARALVANLERLTRSIERDPARFLLDADAPSFRR